MEKAGQIPFSNDCPSYRDIEVNLSSRLTRTICEAYFASNQQSSVLKALNGLSERTPTLRSSER